MRMTQKLILVGLLRIMGCRCDGGLALLGALRNISTTL